MRLVAVYFTAALLSIWAAIAIGGAEAASITSVYAAGHRDVTLNDYGATGLGTFVLTDGDRVTVALCTEADVPHSTTPDVYEPVATTASSPELDALIWLVEGASPIDADEATAAAALAWYLTGARRTIGPPVWSDWSRDFAPISPTSPHRWDALPAFSASHPVGLRAQGADLDRAEALVLTWLERARRNVGPWSLELTDTSSGLRVEVDGPGGPIAGRRVDLTGVAGIDHVITDAAGRATVVVPPGDADVLVTAAVRGPGPRQEWDGPGDVQRMITARSTTVTASWRQPAATTTTTTSTPTTTSTTAPATTGPTTTVPPTTSPPTTSPPTTTTTTPATTTPATSTTSTTSTTTIPPTTTVPTTTTMVSTTTPTTTTTTAAPTSSTTSTTTTSIPATSATTSTTTSTMVTTSTTSATSTSTSATVTTTPASTVVPSSAAASSTTTTTTGATVPSVTARRTDPTRPPTTGSSLPATGSSGGAQLLRVADLLFVVGIALTVTMRLVRR